jgi:hypothetical protein
MNPIITRKLATASLSWAIALLFGAAQALAVGAQETAVQGRKAQVEARPAAAPARAFAYDKKRESVLQGTVTGYTENGQIAPTGAHATVRTTSGDVDVHLGPASYLQAKHFSLAAGEQVRLVGVRAVVNGKDVFLTRIAQKGNQVVTIRSPRGSLLANSAARLLTEAERAQVKQQGGAR